MALRIVTGKPGGGKSYFCVKEYVIEELLWGDRVVVTNLPLQLDELNAYLQSRDPKQLIDLHDRVRLIDEDEAREFYCHRQYGCDFVAPSKEESAKGKRVDYGDLSRLRGVLYVIDEAHVLFDARSWMTSGPHLTFYNSQHRKFGDEVVFCTQFVKLLDGRCTGFAQEFIEVRNYGMERLAIFRGPKGQHEANYTLSPPGPSVRSCHRALFRFDIKIAQCYNTISGVGVSGLSRKPKEKATRGLHPLWGVAAAVLIVFALWKLPDFAVAVINQGIAKVDRVSNAAFAGEPTSSAPPSAKSNVRGDGLRSDASVPALEVVGYVFDSSGRPIVWLSDGTQLGPSDLAAIRRTYVELRTGERIPVQRSRVRPMDAQSPVGSDRGGLAGRS